jgi:hypothetical protein
MARVRPAVRCGAKRTNGQPCRAFAIVGGDVCWSHGGASAAVRLAAYYRYAEQRIRREYEHASARLQRETLAWQVRRVVFAAATLNIPVEQVDPAAILWAYASAGRPFEPRPEIRRDKRFRTPKPPTVTTRLRAQNGDHA